MDNISLSFSQEEVVLILKILGADTIPGVGQQPFGEVSEEVERHLLASAERTLRARAMIAIEDERINIDQTVVALIGTCAVPQLSWLVTRTVKNQLPENRFYHSTPSMFVEHTISGPGIHTFTALARQEQMVERLTNFWELHSPQELPQSLIVPTETIQRMLQELMFAEAAESAPEPESELPISEPVLAVNTIALIDHSENANSTSSVANLDETQSLIEPMEIMSTSYIQCQDSLWQTIRRDDMQIELQSISPAAISEQINHWQSTRFKERNN